MSGSVFKSIGVRQSMQVHGQSRMGSVIVNGGTNTAPIFSATPGDETFVSFGSKLSFNAGDAYTPSFTDIGAKTLTVDKVLMTHPDSDNVIGGSGGATFTGNVYFDTATNMKTGMLVTGDGDLQVSTHGTLISTSPNKGIDVAVDVVKGDVDGTLQTFKKQNGYRVVDSKVEAATGYVYYHYVDADNTTNHYFIRNTVSQPYAEGWCYMTNSDTIDTLHTDKTSVVVTNLPAYYDVDEQTVNIKPKAVEAGAWTMGRAKGGLCELEDTEIIAGSKLSVTDAAKTALKASLLCEGKAVLASGFQSSNWDATAETGYNFSATGVATLHGAVDIASTLVTTADADPHTTITGKLVVNDPESQLTLSDTLTFLDPNNVAVLNVKNDGVTLNNANAATDTSVSVTSASAAMSTVGTGAINLTGITTISAGSPNTHDLTVGPSGVSFVSNPVLGAAAAALTIDVANQLVLTSNSLLVGDTADGAHVQVGSDNSTLKHHTGNENMSTVVTGTVVTGTEGTGTTPGVILSVAGVDDSGDKRNVTFTGDVIMGDHESEVFVTQTITANALEASNIITTGNSANVAISDNHPHLNASLPAQPSVAVDTGVVSVCERYWTATATFAKEGSTSPMLTGMSKWLDVTNVIPTGVGHIVEVFGPDDHTRHLMSGLYVVTDVGENGDLTLSRSHHDTSNTGGVMFVKTVQDEAIDAVAVSVTRVGVNHMYMHEVANDSGTGNTGDRMDDHDHVNRHGGLLFRHGDTADDFDIDNYTNLLLGDTEYSYQGIEDKHGLGPHVVGRAITNVATLAGTEVTLQLPGVGTTPIAGSLEYTGDNIDSTALVEQTGLALSSSALVALDDQTYYHTENPLVEADVSQNLSASNIVGTTNARWSLVDGDYNLIYQVPPQVMKLAPPSDTTFINADTVLKAGFGGSFETKVGWGFSNVGGVHSYERQPGQVYYHDIASNQYLLRSRNLQYNGFVPPMHNSATSGQGWYSYNLPVHDSAGYLSAQITENATNDAFVGLNSSLLPTTYAVATVPNLQPYSCATCHLPRTTQVNGVLIRGRWNSDQWVTSFRVVCQMPDGWDWVAPADAPEGSHDPADYLFDGNTDTQTVVWRPFRVPVQAISITVLPVTCQLHPAMQFAPVLEGDPFSPTYAHEEVSNHDSPRSGQWVVYKGVGNTPAAGAVITGADGSAIAEEETQQLFTDVSRMSTAKHQDFETGIVDGDISEFREGAFVQLPSVLGNLQCRIAAVDHLIPGQVPRVMLNKTVTGFTIGPSGNNIYSRKAVEFVRAQGYYLKRIGNAGSDPYQWIEESNATYWHNPAKTKFICLVQQADGTLPDRLWNGQYQRGYAVWQYVTGKDVSSTPYVTNDTANGPGMELPAGTNDSLYVCSLLPASGAADGVAGYNHSTDEWNSNLMSDASIVTSGPHTHTIVGKQDGQFPSTFDLQFREVDSTPGSTVGPADQSFWAKLWLDPIGGYTVDGIGPISSRSDVANKAPGMVYKRHALDINTVHAPAQRLFAYQQRPSDQDLVYTFGSSTSSEHFKAVSGWRLDGTTFVTDHDARCYRGTHLHTTGGYRYIMHNGTNWVQVDTTNTTGPRVGVVATSPQVLNESSDSLESPIPPGEHYITFQTDRRLSLTTVEGWNQVDTLSNRPLLGLRADGALQHGDRFTIMPAADHLNRYVAIPSIADQTLSVASRGQEIRVSIMTGDPTGVVRLEANGKRLEIVNDVVDLITGTQVQNMARASAGDGETTKFEYTRDAQGMYTFRSYENPAHILRLGVCDVRTARRSDGATIDYFEALYGLNLKANAFTLQESENALYYRSREVHASGRRFIMHREGVGWYYFEHTAPSLSHGMALTGSVVRLNANTDPSFLFGTGVEKMPHLSDSTADRDYIPVLDRSQFYLQEWAREPVRVDNTHVVSGTLPQDGSNSIEFSLGGHLRNIHENQILAPFSGANAGDTYTITNSGAGKVRVLHAGVDPLVVPSNQRVTMTFDGSVHRAC